MTGMFQYVLNKEDRRPQAAPVPEKRWATSKKRIFMAEMIAKIRGIPVFGQNPCSLCSLFQKWDGEANWFIFWLEISIFSLFLLDISRCEEHRKLETVKVEGWDEAGDPISVGFMVDRTSYELDYEPGGKNQEAPLAGTFYIH